MSAQECDIKRDVAFIYQVPSTLPKGAEQITGLEAFITAYKTNDCDQYSLTVARESVDYIKPFQCDSECTTVAKNKLKTLAENFKVSRRYGNFLLFEIYFYTRKADTSNLQTNEILVLKCGHL